MKSFFAVRSAILLVQLARVLGVILCMFASLWNITDFSLVQLYKFLFKNTLLVFYTVVVN